MARSRKPTARLSTKAKIEQIKATAVREGRELSESERKEIEQLTVLSFK